MSILQNAFFMSIVHIVTDSAIVLQVEGELQSLLQYTQLQLKNGLHIER